MSSEMCDVIVFLERPQFAPGLVRVDDHKAMTAAIFPGRRLPPRAPHGGGDLQRKSFAENPLRALPAQFCLFVCLSSRSTSCSKDSEPEVRPGVWPRFRPLRFSPRQYKMLLFGFHFSCKIFWGDHCVQSLKLSYFSEVRL